MTEQILHVAYVGAAVQRVVRNGWRSQCVLARCRSAAAFEFALAS
ncbi:hypothetical protein [Burkholderia ubonensis]|nr:hypothetical protein [Burkholderia ubonensis]